MMTEMTPEQAIDRYASDRDADAFALIVRQYHRLAYAAAARKLARREDAEDATQQAFLNLARAAGTVRLDVAAWLYRAARHAAIDLVRRDATRRRHESTVGPTTPEDSIDAVAWRELSLAVDDAIAALPEDARSLVVEHFLACRSQADLAAALGVNQATISRRLSAAVDRLRERLAERGHTSLGAAALAANLPRLGEADVPAHVAANLTKIGLAAPAKAAVVSTTPTFVIGGAATLAVAAAIVAIVAPKSQPGASSLPVANATTTLADPDVALALLSKQYRLAEGQDLVAFASPFPPVRSTYVDIQFPSANLGTRWVRSLGFEAGHDGLSFAYMSVRDADLGKLAELLLGLSWHAYDAAAIESLDWRPGASDWVLRDGLSEQRKLAALAAHVGRETGRDVRFERRVQRRPCIVLSGATRETAKDARGFQVVSIALEPLDPATMADRVAGRRPRDVLNDFRFEDGSRYLDAPFFADDESTRSLQSASRILYFEPDARLSRSDPDYRAKLQRVIDNLAAQLGGTWTIEDRDVETWVAVVGPGVP